MNNVFAEIRTLYVEENTGASAFGRRLIEALDQIGYFTLTRDRATADAVVQAHGDDTDDGFVGELVISDPRGNVLWSGRAIRPHGETGPMAHAQIINQLQRDLE